MDIGGVLAIAGLFVVLFGAPLSRAMVSIGTVFFGLALIFWSARSKWNISRSAVQAIVILAAMLLLTFIDHFRGSTDRPFDQFILLLPVLLFAPVTMNLRVEHKLIRSVFLIVMLLFALTATWSVVNYFANRAQIDALLLQSKHVPLVTDMHHIYFGLFLAALFWVGVHYGLHCTGRRRIAFLALSAILIICLHILTSRTGLLGFYASAGLYVLMILRKRGSARLKLRLVTAVILLPLLALLFIPSIRMKVENTREDIASLAIGGEELNYKSFAMRTESWKAAWSAISQNWVTGVGSGNYDMAVDRGYAAIKTPLFPQNRIDPHNQFLESWLRFGILGLLGCIAIFVLPFFYRNSMRSSFFWPIWALTLSSFMVESVIQRQMGIVWFGVFYFLFFVEKPSQKGKSEN